MAINVKIAESTSQVSHKSDVNGTYSNEVDENFKSKRETEAIAVDESDSVDRHDREVQLKTRARKYS